MNFSVNLRNKILQALCFGVLGECHSFFLHFSLQLVIFEGRVQFKLDICKDLPGVFIILTEGAVVTLGILKEKPPQT